MVADAPGGTAMESALTDGPSKEDKPSSTTTASCPTDDPAKADQKQVTQKQKTVSYFSLYRYADRQDKFFVLLGIIGAGLNGAGMPIFSIVFGNLINGFGLNVFNPDVLKDQVNTIVPQFIYIGLACWVGATAQMFFWTYTAVRQTNRMRLRYLSSVLRQEVGYFESESDPGKLMQGLNEDCVTIQAAIGDRMGRTLFNVFTAIIGIIVAFTRGWDMTLVMLAVTPLLILAGWLISTFLAKLTTRMNNAYGRANSLATQALGNIRTVYAFTGEERSANAYEGALEDPVVVGIKQSGYAGFIVGFTNLVAFGTYSLALWYGSTRIEDGAYTGGEVLNVLFAALIGGFALGQAAPNVQYFQQGAAAATRVFEVMDRKPKIDMDAPGQELEEVRGELRLENVEFCYPARPDLPVLRGFSLDIPAGQTVALVGESGSGKSTVVGLAERFYDPTAGAVLLDGVDLRALQLRWLRAQFSLVSQEPALFATTIRSNIAFGRPGASDAEIEAAARAANAHRFISALPDGYDTHVGEKGVQMSGGQKQRIAIARAILKSPKLLLLDEATSALDARSEHVVQRALDGLMRTCTTIVVAHRLSTVVGADAIAVVSRGTVVERGSHAQLLQQGGVYATLVSMQRAAKAGDKEPGEEEEPDEEELEAAELDAVAGTLGMHRSTGADAELGVTRQASHLTARTVSLDRESSGRLVPAAYGAVADARSASFDGVALPGTVQSQDAARDGSHKLGMQALADGELMTPARPLAATASAAEAQKGWMRLLAWTGLFKGRRRGSGSSEKEQRRSQGDYDGEEAPPKVKLSRIAALNKPELPALVLGLIGAGALGFMMPAFSIAFSSLISLFYTSDMEELKSGTRKWCLVFLGIGLGALVFSWLQSYFFGLMGHRLGRRVRVLMMSALLRQEVGWYDRDDNASGVLTSKLSTDALAVKGQFGDTMGLLAQNLVTFVGGYALAFSHGWKMTLVVTSVVPIILIAAIIQNRHIVNAAGREDSAFATTNQTAQEAVSNIRTIAAFSMQSDVGGLYGQQLEQPTRQSKKRGLSAGLGFGFSQFVLFGTYSLAFWYAGLLVSRGESTLEQVLKVFFAIFLAAFGIAQAQMFFPDVAKGKAASERVFAIVDRKSKIDASDPSGDRLSECKGHVELVDVTFAYPLRPAVNVFKNFSLDVEPGKTTALVGESGSGKSTVISLIERFYDPKSGQVLLDGHDIRTLNLKWLRSTVGLVSQEPVLFSMTVAENISYGRPGASLEDVIAAARAANAHGFIETLPEGYHTRLGEGGIQLSGGQKQRVAIARAVVKDPAVLLLDEATSALDAESEVLVQQALDALMAGRTTVVVAHRLSTIRNAHRIGVVYKGVLVEQGTHDHLMTIPHGAYARLVQHQLTGMT